MANVINATSTGNGGLVSQGDDSGILNIQTNETTAITVDASQRVGVGVTPSAWTTSIIQLKNSGYRASGNALGLVSNAYYDGTWKYIATDYAQDYYQQDGAHVWRYAGLGTAGNSVSWTEGMRIDNGNLLVGKTSMGVSTQGFGVYSTGEIEANAGSNPAAYFNRTNDGTIMQFRRSGTTVGSISVTTSATAYNTSSDYRLKENITPMTGALAKVAQLKPVAYKWKVDGADGEGFIAHELAEVCPHAVNGEKDAVDAEGNPQYQGIDVSFLVATLTAALQETKALIDTQAETINALTARIVALEGQ